MWIPNDLYRGSSAIYIAERFVGGTAPSSYTSDATMDRGIVREASPQISGAYGWQRVASIGSSDGWAILRAHRARAVGTTVALDVRDWYVGCSAGDSVGPAREAYRGTVRWGRPGVARLQVLSNMGKFLREIKQGAKRRANG